VVGHAAHRDGLFGVLIPAGEGDFQFAGGGYGVIEEEFVEIAQTKKTAGPLAPAV